MKKYLEIVEIEDESVVKRLDVTDQHERQVQRIESGMNINLNHGDYYTRLTESEVELPLV